MDSDVVTTEPIEVAVENVGGISEMEARIDPGITALAGRNATNRTSLLRAIMAACGSDRATLKGDADAGRVELRIGDETYTRTLRRESDRTVFGGNPYLTDSKAVETADLFAFLLDSNPARRAIVHGDTDLRDLIMRPVDTAAIEAEIERLEEERDEVTARLDEFDAMEIRLPGLEAERDELEDEIGDLTTDIRDCETELEAASAEAASGRSETTEEVLVALNDTRDELESVQFDLETERKKRGELETELEAATERLESVSTPARSIDDIEAEVQRLRSERSSVETRLEQLRSVIQFNEGVLDGGTAEVLGDLHDERDESSDAGDRAEALTADLVDTAESVTCWTCGSAVEREAIEATLDRLRDMRSEQQARKRDLDDEIERLREERDELAAAREEREQLERTIERAERGIETAEERIEELEAEREDLKTELERLEATTDGDGADTTDDGANSEVVGVSERLTQLEFERGQAEQRLAEVEEQIADIESALAERESVEERRDEIRDELADCRNRVDALERDAVEAFNAEMERVLERLAYGNVERIWLERVERVVREGRRNVDDTQFELHVVRSGDDGVYEDRLSTLSESEREVTGLVFALSGYLVHDVDEVLPIVVVDSLEAIDSERIGALLSHVVERAPYVVAALLPEDTEALDEDTVHRVDG
jgi:septal ring factor EnvC (AmiA/AmiB activator)